MNTSVVKKYSIPLLLIAFLVVGILGLSHFSMNMNDSEHTSGCPFMNIATLCSINPFEQTAIWQSMFAAVFSKQIFPLLALALLIFLFTFTPTSFLRNSETPPAFVRALRHISRIFVARDVLKKAFSQGILHPKIF